MSLPYRIAVQASNQPTAGGALEHGATALTHFLAPADRLSNGQKVVVWAHAADVNGNCNGAWEVFKTTWSNGSPGSFGDRELTESSTGSFIDWSPTGENVAPLLRVITTPVNEGEQLHSSGTFSGESALLVGGASNPFEAGSDYIVRLYDVALSNNNVFVQMRWSAAGSVDSTGTDHQETITGGYASASLGDNNVGDTLHYFSPSNAAASNASNITANIELFNPAGAGYCFARSAFFYQFSSARGGMHGLLTKGVNIVADGVQIFPSAGTFPSGAWFCVKVPRV